MNLIQQIEAEQIAKLTAARKIPEFRPGDTLRVGVKVVEGERTRVQAYEGVCIARSNKGMGSNFTVRKISFGEGVERVFPLYSPNIDSIEVVRRGVVRRAKLYYLRGRAARRRASPSVATIATTRTRSRPNNRLVSWPNPTATTAPAPRRAALVHGRRQGASATPGRHPPDRRQRPRSPAPPPGSSKGGSGVQTRR